MNRDSHEPSPCFCRLGPWMIAAIVLCNGCFAKPPAAGSPAANSSAASGTATDSDLARDASPRQVAEYVVECVHAKQLEKLDGWMAHQRISADIQSITGGRSQFLKLTQNPGQTALRLIAGRVAAFDATSIALGDESIQAEQATVTIRGNRSGQEGSDILYFVREDDQWKLVPSHR